MIVVWFILLIGPLVFIHELGHFTLAKLFKVKVLRFSLGFGPPIPGLRWTWGETEYQIAVFPLGGYVKMLGEDPTEKVTEEERGRSFEAAALWKRYLIVLAGPVMNLIFPMVIYFFAILAVSETHPASIGTVLPGLPAAQAGIRPGDVLLEVHGKRTLYWQDAVDVIRDRPGKPTVFKVRRDGKVLTLTVTPAVQAVPNPLKIVERTGFIGVMLDRTRPQLGVLRLDGPAGAVGLRSGDVVTAVNGRPVETWDDLVAALGAAGSRPATLSVLRLSGPAFGFADVRELSPLKVVVTPRTPGLPEGGPLAAWGIVPPEMIVDLVEPGSPAAQVGLRAGDLITAVDGKPITSWTQLVNALRAAPKRAHPLRWVTADGTAREHAGLRLREVKETDEFKQEHTFYELGAHNRLMTWKPDPVRIPWSERLPRALVLAPVRTYEAARLMVLGVAQIFRGAIPADTVGGPIMLGYVANKAAGKGWEFFIGIMAFISINLALLNLLPIPVLDGGHCVLFTIEAIQRRPVSEGTRAIVSLVGLAFIVLLMVFAFRNDFVRYILPVFR